VTHEKREEDKLDDWFGELEEESPSEHWHDAPLGTEWEPENRLSEVHPPRRLADAVRQRRLLAAAVLFTLCLLIGLAAGGVFSGGAKRASGSNGVTAPSAVLAPSSTRAPFVPPRSPHPTPTLKRGSRGSNVVALQRELADLGYYSGRIDGQYGPATESAVSRFQSDRGLSPDGIDGPATRRALTKALQG
jgi:hypothetical protein